MILSAPFLCYNIVVGIDINVLTNGWTIAGVVASFLVALIALGLGIWSNIRLNRIQKFERKERFLERIIDWATDISIAGLKFTSVSSTDRELWITIMEQIANTFSVLYRRSIFIKRIILPPWGELGVIVEELRKQLLIHIEHLNAYKEDPIDKHAYLNNSASTLYTTICSVSVFG